MFRDNQNQNPFGAPPPEAAPFGGTSQTQSSGFGNPFGGANTTASLVGGTTTNSTVFGQTIPAFGQGQSSGGFSGRATGGFGQSAGAPSPMSAQSGTMSGQGGFGSTGSGSLFGNTRASGFGNSTSGGGFGTTGASGFGTTNTSGFGTSSVFGTTRSSGFQTTTATTASSGTFGAPGNLFAASSSGTVSNVFGANPPEPPAYSAPSTSQSSMFSDQNRQSISQGSLFGNTKETSTNVPLFGEKGGFGGGATSTADKPFGAPEQRNVFGAQSSNQPSTTANNNPFGVAFSKNAFGGATESPLATKSPVQTLFGKPKESGSQPKTLFGKPDEKQKQSSFGPPIESEKKKTLFGKPLEETMEKTLFGKSLKKSIKEDDNPQPSATNQGLSWKGPRPRSTSPEESDKDMDTRGRSVSPVAIKRILNRERGETRPSKPAPGVGLFGKAIAGVVTSKDSKTQESQDQGAEEPTGQQLEEYDVQEQAAEAKEEDKIMTHQKVLKRRSTQEEIKQKVAIVCKNVPPAWNMREKLRSHFSQFGTVTKVFPYPKKEQATIHFKTHEDADNAKKKGRLLQRGLPMLAIYWGSHMPSKSLAGQAKPSPITFGESSKSRVEAGERRPLASQALRFQVDDELSNMAGTSDVAQEVGIAAKPRPKLGVWSSRENQGQGKSVTSRLGSRPGAAAPSRPQGAGKSTAAKREPKPTQSAPKQPQAASKPAQTARQEKGISNVSLRELKDLVGQTSQERYEILESRDKIIKLALGITKHADLATAQIIKGTCQDMCPEKERYMREYRNGLHLYEILPGTEGLGHGQAQVDHTRAVKEYSRSSADQDMPLAHELRPPPVLEMTMNYLITNIMDLGEEGKWADWYDFLWSRTRGIRKDITQQQLCDPVAVSLVEKCARFHIYCSERLCAEDMMVFDQKINSENLTKCLQTLKEMYADLAEKKGEFCETEAEFRAYLVLMNLNQGDILRESQQLRPEVRESALMKFSVAVYTALKCNNYVKFFKLVKQAPFLCACIMHRYFNQVRGRALRTMLRAYRGTGAYPLSNLVKQLGFESETEAGQFCVHHGVQVADGAIPVGRSKFIEPEEAFQPQRAITLVESKQTESVGETINGGPVPNIPVSVPSDSFDASGRLRVTDLQIAKEEETGTTTTTGETYVSSTLGPPQKAVGSPQRSSPAQETTPQESETAKHALVSNDMVKEIARELFFEVIDEFVLPMSNNIVQATQVYLSLASPLYQELEIEILRPLLKDVCEEAKEEKRSELAERMARERAEVSARKAKVTEELSNSLTAEVATLLCLEVAQEEARTVETQLKQASEERVTMEICKELTAEIVREQTDTVGDEVYQADVVERLAELEECRQAMQFLRTARFFKKWKDEYHKRLRLKNSMTTFPPGPSMLSHKDQIDALIPESQGLSQNAIHLGCNAHLTFDTPAEVLMREDELEHNISVYNKLQKLIKERAWRAYQDIGRVWRHLPKTDVSWKSVGEVGRLNWKLVISVPENTNDLMTSTLNKWVRAKFRRGTVPNSDSAKTCVLSLYTQPVEGQWPVTSVSVCVREVNGLLSQEDLELVEEKRHLLGTSGILFVLDPATEEQDLWEEAAERLLQVVQVKPSIPCLPLVVVCQGTIDSNLVITLNLEFLVSEGLVSQYEVVCLPDNVDDPRASKELLKGVRWLEQRCPPPPKLTSLPLRDYIEDGLSEHYFTPVYTDLHRRRKQQLLDQSPSVQISLFNAVVAHLAAKSSATELASISWPITELCLVHQDQCLFDWNCEDQLEYIERCVLTLSLPEFDPGDPNSESWEDACQDVWGYVGAVAEEEGNNAALYSRVRWLIQKVEEDFADTCSLTLREESCKPRYVNMPWTDIILACVDYKLTQLDYSDPRGEEDNEMREIQVHTLLSSPDDFSPPNDWAQALTDLIHPEPVQVKDTLVRSVKRKREESGKNGVPKLPKVDLNSTYIELTPLSQVEVEKNDSAHQLQQLMAEEKKISRQFEDYLTKILNEDISDTRMNTDTYSGYEPINTSCYDDVINRSYVNKIVSQTPRNRKRNSIPNSWTPALSAYKARTLAEEPVVPGLNEVNTTDLDISLAATRRRSSLADDILLLNSSIGAQKTADKLFEIKLQSYLRDGADFM